MNTSVPPLFVIRESDAGNSGKARAAEAPLKSMLLSTVPKNQLFPEEEDKSAPASRTTLPMVKNSMSGKSASLLRCAYGLWSNNLFG